jgi:hypothetical protein
MLAGPLPQGSARVTLKVDDGAVCILQTVHYDVSMGCSNMSRYEVPVSKAADLLDGFEYNPRVR